MIKVKAAQRLATYKRSPLSMLKYFMDKYNGTKVGTVPGHKSNHRVAEMFIADDVVNEIRRELIADSWTMKAGKLRPYYTKDGCTIDLWYDDRTNMHITCPK